MAREKVLIYLLKLNIKHDPKNILWVGVIKLVRVSRLVRVSTWLGKRF